MITSDNFEIVLELMGYKKNGDIYEKSYVDFNVTLKVDVEKQKLYYPPEIKGGDRNDYYDDSHKENIVVFECVNRLLTKGYRPEDIELEKAWHLGHDPKGGRADICVVDPNGKMLFIIECKTFGRDYQVEYKNTINDGGQLFSYWQQEGSCKWILLYASELTNNKIEYVTDSINCSDDNNILTLAKKDSTIKLYKDAHTVEELFEVWDETYEKLFYGDVVFRDDTKAYQIGVKPLRKIDLKDFSENNKVVNKFEEILRHNNVSDKENAFNRLIALFICKLVDEIQKGDNDEVEFQYKVGTDTYESLQDRLQRLHKEGMEKFMREEIFYVSDNYAEKLVQQYTGQKRQKMIEELRNTLRILKFYTNNDFAFKDVHNEALFYQNGKILVEIVQLFERYRIIDSNDVQMLGDLFEQLLNKGFKQNEGQFFTPIPITRFIWDSIPLEGIIKEEKGVNFPKIIDYSCGAGHFLTQGFKAVNDCVLSIDPTVSVNRKWAENKIYGIEKDYRLARVSKISLFMHGAGDGNIIFGDGLENYPEKAIAASSFDILVANPPYAVKAFKPHLKLKNNELKLLNKISNEGSEIETLFVERISQLVKPNGIAVVVLPISILNKESESFVAARETLLHNFLVRAIVLFGRKTFGETGTNTAVMFLQKFDEPPKRVDMVTDSVNAIFGNTDLRDWEDDEIFNGYLQKISVEMNNYIDFIQRKKEYDEWQEDEYFGQYFDSFVASNEYINKCKQKTFLKLSDDKQKRWFNTHFYDYVSKKEAEKITYFALTYKQRTLVVSSPDKNKDQELFLGYKWSKRKGSEGIQILSPGGLLYDEDDRRGKDTVAEIIRKNFEGEECSIIKLANYYYYLNLKDMIDFSGTDFNKAIKTTKPRIHKVRDNTVNYKLSDKIFEIGIGDRVLSSEVIEDGEIPVLSANVYDEFGKINKKNIEDFSVPSVVWGIDGDWMVRYIPENYPFYPTDHCGIIRVRSDEINLRYLAVAVWVEGRYEKFSRYNRASSQRVKNLIVQIPKKIKEQEKIVDEIDEVDKKIVAEENQIARINQKAKDKFADMFGNLALDINHWGFEPLGEICDVRDGTHESPKYIYDGGFPLLTSQNFTKGFVDFNGANNISEEDFNAINKRSKVDIGDIVMPMIGTIGSPVIIDTDKPFAIKNVALIKFAESKMFAEYIRGVLDSDYFQDIVLEGNRGSNRKFVSLDDLRKLKIPMAPEPLQKEYAKYLSSLNNSRKQAEERYEKHLLDKEKLISKYFD